MAKGKATCTCKKCGKKWTKELYGMNRKECDEKVAWYEETFTVCSDCAKAEADEAFSNTEKAFIENGLDLATLTGTEKQVSWAREIRSNILSKMLRDIEMGVLEGEVDKAFTEYLDKAEARIEEREAAGTNCEGARRRLATAEAVHKAFSDYYAYILYLMETKTSASWWIDHRPGERGELRVEAGYQSHKGYSYDKDTILESSIARWLSDNILDERNGLSASALYREFCAWLDDQASAGNTEPTLMIPETQATTTEATVKIDTDKGYVDVVSDKDSIIINTLKGHGYRWYGSDGTWSRQIQTDLTTPEDAMAETANILLNAGVPVICKDAAAREKAISGDYKPIPTRVITTGGKDLLIGWQGKNDDIYRDAKAIKGSKWDSDVRKVRVSTKQYLDIEGFAELYGFVFTPAAAEAMSKAKAAALASTVKVTKGKEYMPDAFDGAAVLESTTEVKAKYILED